MANKTGGPGPDTLTGTAGTDVLIGLAGDDILSGLGGNDLLEGGLDNDILKGGTEIDTATYANAGAGVTISLAITVQQDTVGDGKDTLTGIENLIGSIHNDSLIGNTLNNVIEGGDGDDSIDGGTGSDTASYASATAAVTVDLNMAVNVTGGAGTDTLTSIERLIGSAFDDRFADNFAGNNRIDGGACNDWIVAGGGNDTFIGGTNDIYGDIVGSTGDTIDYSPATKGVTIDLQVTTAQNTGGAGMDVILGFEHIIGTDFNDNLKGTAGINFFVGGDGNDVINGRGSDRDVASYTSASNAVTVDLNNLAAQDTGQGFDTLTNIEGLVGSDFNDELFGVVDRRDFFHGGLGDDTINGSGGGDFMSYEGAGAAVTVDLKAGTATGGHGNDKLTNIEHIHGSAYDDDLTGDAESNFISGGEGADKITGGTGGLDFDFASYRYASAGVTASLLDPGSNTGEAAGDTYKLIDGLQGSQFDDVLVGELTTGSDFLMGGLGADTLDGGGVGGGGDWADYMLATAAVKANLNDSAKNTGEAAGDIYISIENLRGSDFNDTLTGTDEGNFFRGGLGADKIDGLGGFDWASYANATKGVTANIGNTAVNTGEAAGDTYTSIEALQGSINDDTLTGNSGLNLLNGGAGADKLNGGGGIDYADYRFHNFAGVGITIVLSNPSFNSHEAIGDTYTKIEGVIGSTFADTLVGDAGDNFLRGLQGADTLDAGAGGSDWVDYTESTGAVSVSLLTQTTSGGHAAGDKLLNGFENALGSSFNDILKGDTLSNILDGGFGSDTLTGDLGSDNFVFNDTLDQIDNVDGIMDFVSGTDKILLDNSVFTKLTTLGTLGAGRFVANVGGTAVDANDNILYDISTGLLYYDSDGSGVAAKTQFAGLSLGPTITNADFVVI